jgi:hypothetical protein
MDATKTDLTAIQTVMRLYFFLLSDAYREYEKEEVRCDCYGQAQFHFDDGVKFILDASGERFPVDHPLWRAYADQVAEVEARVVHAEQRKRERLAALKGVRLGFERFCGRHGIGAEQRLVELGLLSQARLAALARSPEVVADEQTAEETIALLEGEWRKLVAPEPSDLS